MRDPLLIPACLFAAGVAFARAGWITAGSAAALAAVALLLAAFGRFNAIRWIYTVCGSMAVFLAGTANMAVRTPTAPPPASAEGRRVLTACVLDQSEAGDGRMRLTVHAKDVGGVQVNAPVSAGRPQHGDVVRGEVELRAVRNYGLEGSFDRETFLSRRGVFWQGVMGSKGRWEVTSGACEHSVSGAVHRLRRAAGERASAMFGANREQEALLRALLLGDGGSLKKAWVEDFRRTGTYHALVISGGHITMICGVFLLWRSRFGWGARVSVLLAAAVAWFYSVVAGGATPALRAAAAMSLAVGCLWLYRKPRLLNILATVALVFLAVDPGQLFEASFQLSFLAVASIGLLVQSWSETGAAKSNLPKPWHVEVALLAGTLAAALGGKAHRWDSAIRAGLSAAAWAGQTLMVSGAVQFGLLLPMAVYFHRVSLTGLLANIVVTPVVSMAIPVGFLALVTNSGPLAGMAVWLIVLAQRMAAWFAAWEPEWPVPAPPGWLAVGFAAALICAVLVIRSRRALAAAPLAATLASAALIVTHPFPPRQVAGELEITLLDTGQSESLLLGLPQGGFVLVDAGGAPGRPGSSKQFDVGEDLIAPYLRQRGIKRLEGMVITHLHEDHAGGAPYLIRNFRPARFWTSYTPDHPKWRLLDRELRRVGAEIHSAEEGSQWNWGSVTAKTLAPSPEQRWRGRPANNDSLVLLLRYGRRSFLLTGDIERGAGDRLAGEGLLERVDVLKMPHHGARSALSEPLLDSTQPALALISAGWKNSFGFPHPDTLQALRSRRAIPLRTDLLGTVTVRTNGRWLSYESYSESAL